MVKLQYFRGQGGFTKKFSLFQDGSAFDISLLTSPTVRWHFKEVGPPVVKREISWDGTPSGTNSEIAAFVVPGNFFNVVVEYESQVEVFDSGVLVLHNQEIIIVEVLEPAGVHTD